MCLCEHHTADVSCSERQLVKQNNVQGFTVGRDVSLKFQMWSTVRDKFVHHFVILTRCYAFSFDNHLHQDESIISLHTYFQSAVD